MYNIDNMLQQGKRVKIIFEGPDGSGKSALALAVFSKLHEIFPYECVLARNPSSAKLYEQMHAGVLTPFQIGMSTMADALKTERIYQSLGFKIIVQDRSAIISGQAYNGLGMNTHELGIYEHAVKEFTPEIHSENHIIILLTHNWRQESTVFSDENYQKEHRPTQMYHKFALNKSDAFGNRIVPYHNDHSIEEDAENILEIINGYFGDQNT